MDNRSDGIDNAKLGFTTLIGALLVVITMVAVHYLYLKMQADVHAEQNHGTPSLVSSYRADMKAKLGGYAYKDKAAGVVSLPVERAMELALSDLRSARQAALAPKPEPEPVKPALLPRKKGP